MSIAKRRIRECGVLFLLTGSQGAECARGDRGMIERRANVGLWLLMWDGDDVFQRD
jgi:hypothetical protein